MEKIIFSVIVPVRDEERMIGPALERLEAAFAPGEAELIVVDGQSRDRTAEIARSRPRVRVISSPPGRGGQLNRGAAAARGEVFLFLHVDAALPPGAPEMIRAALAEPGADGGCFRIATAADPGRGRLYRLLLKTADWRSLYTRLPYGDQAIFVTREIFEKLGGFKDYPIMEDLDFSRRLAREGRIVRLPARVRVSGRRWEKNLLGNFLKLKTFPLLFRLGVSPERLARLYREVR